MFAVKATEQVVGVSAAFGGVAFDARGDKITVRIAALFGAWDDVIETPGAAIKASEAVETEAAFAVVNGAAMSGVFEEIDLFEVGRIMDGADTACERNRCGDRSGCGSLVRTANLVG